MVDQLQLLLLSYFYYKWNTKTLNSNNIDYRLLLCPRGESPQTPLTNVSIYWVVELETLYKLCETLSLTHSALFGPSCKFSKCSTWTSFCLRVETWSLFHIGQEVTSQVATQMQVNVAVRWLTHCLSPMVTAGLVSLLDLINLTCWWPYLSCSFQCTAEAAQSAPSLSLL